MDPVTALEVAIYGGGAVIVGFLAIRRWGRRLGVLHARGAALERAWRVAASEVGLTEVVVSRAGSDRPRLEARAGRFWLRLGVNWLSEAELATRVVIDGLGHVGKGLLVRRKADPLEQERTLPRPRFRLGLPAWDELFNIYGEETLVRSVLDVETRSTLLKLFSGSLPLSGEKTLPASVHLTPNGLQVVFAHQEGRLERELEREVADGLRAVLELAQRLVQPTDLPARLAANLRVETEPELRLETLELLRRLAPEHPLTREAVLASLADASDGVRFAAALSSGREGHEVLRQLVESSKTPETIAVQAVEALGVWLSVEAASACLGAALHRGRGELARACLATLSRHGRLGRRGDAQLENLLLSALKRQQPELVLAAAQALGPLGTVAAVPALRDLEAAGRRDLAQAARQAIGEIQGRLAGAEHGQLALADAAAGALSLAGENRAGQLSLAGQGSGELSLSEEEPR